MHIKKLDEGGENCAAQMQFSIISDEDENMGIISLRHIDPVDGLAEFSIEVKEDAMGKGYAWYGMEEVLDIAFEKLELSRVYWKVKADNKRALGFFDKHSFKRCDHDIPGVILERHSDEKDLVWYALWKGDDYHHHLSERETVAGCRIIKIKTVATIEAGELSVFENETDIDFAIQRIYYITKVPEGAKRGGHAHKKLKQVLFCPYGKIRLVLENCEKREEIILSDPSVGVVIEKPIWREMLWLEKNSVLVVAASEKYDPGDYIFDHEEFLDYIK